MANALTWKKVLLPVLPVLPAPWASFKLCLFVFERGVSIINASSTMDAALPSLIN